VHDFETLMLELESFSEQLASKPMFVAASKMDVAQGSGQGRGAARSGASAAPAILRNIQRDGAGHRSLEIRFGRAHPAGSGESKWIIHSIPPKCGCFGALLEKESTTPEYYPLTLNALVAACNQKSNRWPVTEYDEGEVLTAIDRLRARGFAASIVGSGRVAKYAQRFTEKLNLGRRETAILCVLMLRAQQTVGEIKGRTERMYAFTDLDETRRYCRR